MKKFLIILLAVFCVFALSNTSFASGNTGCGVGSMIFQGKDGLLSQLLALTTNGILGNQTFGITSGTVGCSQARGIVSNERVELFVADNMDNLINDVSQGRGEYLNTLAVLMEVSEQNRTAFYGKMQNNFSKIFPSGNITSKEVVKNINNVMQES